MVIDFTDLKKIVKEEIVDKFDHATVFNKNTPHLELATLLSERDHDVILVDYQPTTEMMVIDFAEKLVKDFQKIFLYFLLNYKKLRALLQNGLLVKINSYIVRYIHFTSIFDKSYLYENTKIYTVCRYFFNNT